MRCYTTLYRRQYITHYYYYYIYAITVGRYGCRLSLYMRSVTCGFLDEKNNTLAYTLNIIIIIPVRLYNNNIIVQETA